MTITKGAGSTFAVVIAFAFVITVSLIQGRQNADAANARNDDYQYWRLQYQLFLMLDDPRPQ